MSGQHVLYPHQLLVHSLARISVESAYVAHLLAQFRGDDGDHAAKAMAGGKVSGLQWIVFQVVQLVWG